MGLLGFLLLVGSAEEVEAFEDDVCGEEGGHYYQALGSICS